MTKWQKVLEDKGWNSLYLSNHDQARPVSRFGNDKEYRVVSAKMLGTWLHMMQGTPYIYQGYTRTLENEMLLIVTNFSSEQPIFNLPETISYKSHDLLISNYAVESNENIKSFQMKPYEARVYLLRS
jgi:hypothetical protein